MRPTYQTSWTAEPSRGAVRASPSARSLPFTAGLIVLQTIEKLAWSVYDLIHTNPYEQKHDRPASGTTSAADVKLFMGPWVAGTKATAYFGPIDAEAFVDNAGVKAGPAWEKAELEVMEALKLKASELGANSVVSVELIADPWAKHRETGEIGLRVTVIGTPALLVRVF